MSQRGFLDPKFDTVDYNNYIYTSDHLLLVVPLRSDIDAPWRPSQAESAQRPNGLTRGIELANFEHRALVALRDHGKYSNLSGALDGQVLFSFASADGASAIKFLNYKNGRAAKTIIKDAADFKLSSDGKKLVVRQEQRFAVLDPIPDQNVEKYRVYLQFAR